ncbi:hypothetical protein J2T16_002754 [Paenibacillus intestini]|nr:hypothetical protein [Paenibacillus intestini]
MEIKPQIDQLLNQLNILTETFVINLEEKSSDQVEVFVNERQVIVGRLIELSATYQTSQDQQEKLNHILTYDSVIESRMLALKNEAQQWLIQRNVARNQRNVYEAKFAADSYLMDKRK